MSIATRVILDANEAPASAAYHVHESLPGVPYPHPYEQSNDFRLHQTWQPDSWRV